MFVLQMWMRILLDLCPVFSGYILWHVFAVIAVFSWKYFATCINIHIKVGIKKLIVKSIKKLFSSPFLQ